MACPWFHYSSSSIAWIKDDFQSFEGNGFDLFPEKKNNQSFFFNIIPTTPWTYVCNIAKSPKNGNNFQKWNSALSWVFEWNHDIRLNGTDFGSVSIADLSADSVTVHGLVVT